MARPIVMTSVTLLAAAASSLLPALPSYLAPAPLPISSITSGVPLQGSPPPPNTVGTIRPAPQQTSTPLVSAPGGTQGNSSRNQPKPGVDEKTVQQASTTSPLRILNVDASGTIIFKAADGIYDVYLLLANQSGRTQDVEIGLVLEDRHGAQLKSAQIAAPVGHSFKVKPYETVVQSIQIKFVQTPGSENPSTIANQLLPATGLLRFLATPHYDTDADKCKCERKRVNNPCQELPNPGFLDQAIVLPEHPLPSSTRVAYIVGMGLLVSTVVVVITGVSLYRKKILLGRRMGNATWTFGQSWGANVTIGAGLLGTFLTLLAFPDHPQILDKGSYTLLQALFAAIIALAPLVYGLFRRDVQASTNGIATTDSQGYVIMFLLAGGLVLWGAIGQLTALGVLIREFVLSGSLAVLTGDILEALVLLLWILLVAYALRTLYLTAKQLSASKTDAAGPQPAQLLPAGMPLPAPTAADLKPPMHSWAFL